MRPCVKEYWVSIDRDAGVAFSMHGSWQCNGNKKRGDDCHISWQQNNAQERWLFLTSMGEMVYPVFSTISKTDDPMATPNYSFEKRQRDLAKKQRKEEKNKRKSESASTPAGSVTQPSNVEK